MTTTRYHPVVDALNADALHSAFIIDKEGNEIRITREMIVASCNKLFSNEEKQPQQNKNIHQ